MRNLLIYIILLILLVVFSLPAQDTVRVYDLGEEIVVTASRYPTVFKNVARSVTLVNSHQIKQLPVHSLQDVLQYIPSVDLRQRGPAGVQADASIRGSSFEQTLILVDGFRVSDPQTGHHNLNIPVSLQNAEKIEVLRGPGSRFYGPNALGGVINIITAGINSSSININGLAGDYGLYNTGISLQYPTGNFSHRLSYEKSGGDGYRPATDFDNWSAGYTVQFKSGNHQALVSLSHLDKDFGAGGFYVSNSNEWEHTKTTLFRSQYKYQSRQFHISPRFFWRQNNDHYLYDRSKPEGYHNNHTTDVYGMDLQAEYFSPLGISGIGIETSREQISGKAYSSANLGSHQRDKTGIYLEQQLTAINKLNIILGLSAFNYSDWGWKSWPGMDVNYHLFPGLNIYGSVNQAFRVPTYYELYYNSPSNQGNPQLLPEKSVEYEVGLNGHTTSWIYSMALFHRQGKNLIDWAKAVESDPWKTMNIVEMNMSGIEVSSKFQIPEYFLNGFPNYLQFAYTYLKGNHSTPELHSKYVLNYLQHQLLFTTGHSLYIKALKAHWQVRYEDRINGTDHWLTDLKITYDSTTLMFYIEATNLLNTDYENISSVPMPGRWIKAGFNYKLSFDMTE